MRFCTHKCGFQFHNLVAASGCPQCGAPLSAHPIKLAVKVVEKPTQEVRERAAHVPTITYKRRGNTL